MKGILFVTILAAILLAGCAAPTTDKEGKNPNQAALEAAQIANPASAYCINHGGNLTIVTAEDGSQSGMCTFTDGTKCEEWAYMLGDCPCRECPQLSPPSPEFCKGGELLDGGKTVCGCQKPPKCQMPGYIIEKIGEDACSEDSNCLTPGEYLLMSRCPFSSKCIDGKCAVICPTEIKAPEPPAEPEKTFCTPEQKAAQICTMDYTPVCGNDDVTYGNACGACASEGVEYWVRGECEA